MNLKEWLDKNCPDDGPRWYSFDYKQYRRDTLNQEKRHKEFATKRFEKIVEDVIRKEFENNLETCSDSHYLTERNRARFMSERSILDTSMSINPQHNDIETFGNKKYIVDDIFINRLIAKIKTRM